MSGTRLKDVMRAFERWGWAMVAAMVAFDAVMVNDMFLVRPGEHGILTRWHGAPWPIVLLLAAPFAHVWFLTSVWLVVSRRPGRGVSRSLMVALAASIVVFHALLWDNGTWIKPLLMP